MVGRPSGRTVGKGRGANRLKAGVGGLVLASARACARQVRRVLLDENVALLWARWRTSLADNVATLRRSEERR